MKAGKHSDIPLSYFQMVGEWRDLTVVTKLQNVFEFVWFLGDADKKLETFAWTLKQGSWLDYWST